MRLPKGIRRRGSAFYADLTVNGRRKTATAHTLEEAKTLRASIEADLRAGKGRDMGAKGGKDWTVGETFDRLRSTAAPHGWRDARAEHELVRQGQAVVDHFGHSTLLKGVGLDAIEAYCRELEDQRKSNGTINHRLAALSKMFTFAHRRGGVSSKPFIPRRRVPVARLRYLTKDQERAPVSTLRQWSLDDAADAVEVLIDTGMRCGELDRLTAEDVDLERGTITIWITRNERPRAIP